MSVSILTVDDETDITELFRQHSRHEVRQGVYVLHFACSADEALARLADGIRPQLIVIPLRHQHAGRGRPYPAAGDQEIVAGHSGHDGRHQGDDERRRQARELGACEFITKPVDFGHLKAQLRQLADAAA
jgi:CheY-like chemotaxis protein